MTEWQAWELTPRAGVDAWLGTGFLRLAGPAPGACFFVRDGERVRVRAPKRHRHLRQRLASAGALRAGCYEPENERFGGPARRADNEWFFVQNSWVVAHALARGPRVLAALELGALLLRQSLEASARARFCQDTAAGWAQTLSPRWADAMQRVAAAATPEVLRTVHVWWRTEVRCPAGHRTVQLASAAVWSRALRTYLHNAHYEDVLRAQWHMQNHRLGLRPAEECWLAHLLSRAQEAS